MPKISPRPARWQRNGTLNRRKVNPFRPFVRVIYDVNRLTNLVLTIYNILTCWKVPFLMKKLILARRPKRRESAYLGLNNFFDLIRMPMKVDIVIASVQYSKLLTLHTFALKFLMTAHVPPNGPSDNLTQKWRKRLISKLNSSFHTIPMHMKLDMVLEGVK